MNTYKLTPKERFVLVMECRSNSLTDRQWCRNQSINTMIAKPKSRKS